MSKDSSEEMGKAAMVEVDEPIYSNPFLSFYFWLKSWAIPGMGMFCEAYFIFSIGNIGPILSKTYPNCFGNNKQCSVNLVRTVSYIQVIGIILGMLSLGYLGDKIGRKWGSVTTASILTLGAVMLIASNGVTEKGFLIMFMISQFVFGYGVGGEYPMASSSASERAEAIKSMRNRRGELVVNTFAMQGWGNFINVVVLVLLMVIFNQKHSTYSVHKLDAVWRISFAVGLVPLLFMVWFRVFKLHESRVWKKVIEKKHSALVHANFIKFYWHRLAGCALSWFFWDVSFYGNKLFQSTFIGIIIGKKASILTNLLYTMLNSGVALVGYYFAAYTVDRPWMGRVRMQLMGFTLVFLMFLMCAVFYPQLIKPGSPIKWFQTLYFLSSFFGQWGPNCTTWLLPGEVFPTEVRATAHGICAATGKAGALLAGIWFNYIGNRKKFYVTAFFNMAGMIFTLFFVPDVLRLSLREGDRRWQAIMMGNVEAYKGEAVNPVNLSIWERMTGVGKVYDPVQDAKDLKMESSESYAAGSVENELTNLEKI